MRATQRLNSRGFEAYLVGGCVRDLLLDRAPKDYDIATAARPPQVKRTFARNCRIIGRRFKLAHLHFNNNTKILEVSTFRRTPELENAAGDDDLLITRDNEFGNAEEDALRRDFTVNALFLDPTRNCILDYTNGLADVRARLIRTIGDPRVRFREDPVRILRAAKFAGRLGFQIEAETFAAMAETSGDLVRSAPPRLLEEILRLLRGGHALESFQLLRDVGALKCLVPVLAEFLATARHDQRVAFWRLLEALDHTVHDGHVPQNAVLLGVLLVCPVLAKAEVNPGRSPSSIAEELLGPLSLSLRLPRRDAGCLKRICGVQHRFTETDETKRFRMAGFVHGPYFDEALQLFELRVRGGAPGSDGLDRWHELARTAGHHAPADDFAGEGAVDEVAAEADAPRDDSGDAGATGEEAADAGTAEPEIGEPGLGQPAFGEQEPGRRRRRGRRGRRGRGRDRDQGFDAPATTTDAQREDAAGQADLPAGTELPPDGDGVDAPAAAREAPPDGDQGEARSEEMPFVPEPGATEAGATEIGATGQQAEAPATAEHGAFEGGGFGEPGRRRRRRRRRGRGRGRGDRPEGAEERFPASEAPPPHGEATDAEATHHAPPEVREAQVDADAPRPEGAGEDQPADAEPAGAGAEGFAGQSPGDGERHGRRRRRRGRRGRGRRGDGPPEGGPHPQQQGPHPQQHQQQQQQQQHRPQQPPQHGRREHRRHEHRDQRRRGHGGPRDVDVVPRHRDRRGKVEVIEPPPLDLSAFDVELDPKRVPTFGSIVEGKNRPKKRTPRVPDDGVDDYKPPPPPGSGPGPSAPPPPPPKDDPDTFGDW